MDLHFVFGVLGNFTALLLFLAPVTTFQSIVSEKSTQQFSGFSYVTTLLNCLVSAWYGLPFVSKDNFLVSTINGIGVVIEAVYVVMFAIYAVTNEVRKKILGLLALVLAIFGIVVLVSLVAFHGNARKLVCGSVAALCSVIMYASPLSVADTVIKTRSVENMPLPLSLLMFLCGTSWFVYGLLGHDLFVAIPNGFGCALGALQLILYCGFCGNKGDTADDKKPPITSYAKPSRKTPPTENLFPPMDPKCLYKCR